MSSCTYHRCCEILFVHRSTVPAIRVRRRVLVRYVGLARLAIWRLEWTEEKKRRGGSGWGGGRGWGCERGPKYDTKAAVPVALSLSHLSVSLTTYPSIVAYDYESGSQTFLSFPVQIACLIRRGSVLNGWRCVSSKSQGQNLLPSSPPPSPARPTHPLAVSAHLTAV